MKTTIRKKTILQSIRNEIDSINWTGPTPKDKAYNLCIAIYNNYLRDGGDWWQFRSVPSKYITKILTTNWYSEVVSKLEGNILESFNNGSYSTKTNTSKAYRFHRNILEECNNYDFVELKSPFDIWDDIPIVEWMNDLVFDPGVDDFIESFRVEISDILIDDQIPDLYIDLQMDMDSCRYGRDKAIDFCKAQGEHLIKWRKKFYCANPKNFIKMKTDEIKKIYKGYLFDVDNKIWRANRNETNRRLDYNLTNMKGAMIDRLTWRGERLVELDISNCQFAILANIFQTKGGGDPLFIKLASTGRLYEYIARSIPDMTEAGAKELMFRVSFDKVKAEYDSIRDLFPETMKFIDGYKKSNKDYKSFSNLLQNTESSIMIDGLSTHLYKKGYIFFPIHDAFRVPESQVDSVLEEIRNYFEKMDFRCLVRVKNGKK